MPSDPFDGIIYEPLLIILKKVNAFNIFIDCWPEEYDMDSQPAVIWLQGLNPTWYPNTVYVDVTVASSFRCFSAMAMTASVWALERTWDIVIIFHREQPEWHEQLH